MNIDDIISEEQAKVVNRSRVDAIIAEEEARAATKAQNVRNIQNIDYDPTEGMSTTEKVLAGIGSGMTGVAQSIGNMVGLVEDETIAERKSRDKPLSDTGAGTAGQILGEVASLAPLGAIGLPAKAGKGAGLLTKALTKAPSSGLGKTAQAAAQGAAAGSILADPNERVGGAATGAVVGSVLNRAMAGLSRLGKTGMVKKKQSAKDLENLIEKTTGKKPFIPLTQAADTGADALSARGKATADVISLLPSARAKFQSQADELADDTFNMLLRTSFKGKNSGPMASEVFRRTGDVNKAIDAARSTLKTSGPLTKTQKVLQDASYAKNRGRFTPKQLLRASAAEGRRLGATPSTAPLRHEATLMDDILSGDLGKSTVESRDLYHKLGKFLGWAVDKIPTLGPFLSSKAVQKTLMGDSRLQLAMKKAMESGEGAAIRAVMEKIRIAASGQTPDSPDVDLSHIKELGG